MAKDIQQIKPTVKKTALDYILPHNHNAVPLALQYAYKDYHDETHFGTMELALEHGVTKTEIANKWGVSPSMITKIIKKFRKAKK